jgi:F420H(2)-dependent quinone reductase
MRAQGLVNLVVRGLLRTPGLSRIIGSRLVTLYVVGRKSGRRYTVPVSYLAHGDDLLIGTSFGWARNLRTGEPVAFRFKGKIRLQTSRLRPLSPTSSRHTHTWRPRIRHSPALAGFTWIRTATPATGTCTWPGLEARGSSSSRPGDPAVSLVPPGSAPLASRLATRPASSAAGSGVDLANCLQDERGGAADEAADRVARAVAVVNLC